MPILPENKARYPKNWKEISYNIRVNRAKNRCEVCGLKNHSIIKRLPDGFTRPPSPLEWEQIHNRIKYSHSNLFESLKYFGFIKVVLTVAHLDHTPENCEPHNLKALCQKCHNNYDMQHRRQTRKNAKLINQLSINF